MYNIYDLLGPAADAEDEELARAVEDEPEEEEVEADPSVPFGKSKLLALRSLGNSKM